MTCFAGSDEYTQELVAEIRELRCQAKSMQLKWQTGKPTKRADYLYHCVDQLGKGRIYIIYNADPNEWCNSHITHYMEIIPPEEEK